MQENYICVYDILYNESLTMLSLNLASPTELHQREYKIQTDRET